MAQKGKIKKPVMFEYTPQEYVTYGGKYNVPKDRKVVRTINLNNGKITVEQDADGDVYFFRNGKYMPDNVVKNYKYFDNKTKTYRKLSNNANSRIPYTKPHVPYIDMLMKDKEKDFRDSEVNGLRIVPNRNIITLRTKGRMNLADIPTNELDSIFVSAGRAGIDPKTALGLVGKEDTFGGHSKLLGKPWFDSSGKPDTLSLNLLVNNHTGLDVSKYGQYTHNLFSRHAKGENQYKLYSEILRDMPEDELVRMNNEVQWEYNHGLLDKYKNQVYDKNDLLADAFKRYQANPKLYNYGQKNYQGMVENIANEVWNEPQIQKYWNENGQKQYRKGMIERSPKTIDDNYDTFTAVLRGYNAGETGHWPSRDYITGDILKYPSHPTFGKALYADMGEGYLPVKRKKGKLKANTQPTPMRQWMDNTFKQPVIPFK